jgi:hypothetical protein
MRRPRTRKRTLLIPRMTRLLLLLTGGAIINVAVAWGLAAVPPLSRPSDCDDNDESWWASNVPAGFESAKHDRFNHLTSVGEDTISWPDGVGAQVSRFIAQRCRFGWPLLTMERSVWIDFAGGRPLTDNQRVPPLVVTRNAWIISANDELGGLPLKAIWPGFAINTIFYAAILWLLFAAPGFVRRRIRARRRQCPACAYPVGTSNICTECGRPVRIAC